MSIKYFLLLLSPWIVFALPQDPVVTAGAAEWMADGNEMSINVSDGAMIE